MFTDKQPMLRDGRTGDWIGTFGGHKGAVWSCRVDPTGNLAATASGDFSVKLWDAITGQVLRTWSAGHIMKAVAFTPHASTWLATAGHEGLVRIFDLMATGKDGKSVGSDDPFVTIEQEPVDDSSTSAKAKVMITKLQWQDDTHLMVGCSDGTLRLWHVSDMTTPPTLLQTLVTEADSEIRDLEIRSGLPDGSTRLSVAAGKAVYFYQLSSSDNTWTHLKTIAMPVHFKDEGGVSLHPNGHVFCVGGSDLWVHVFDYDTEQELDTLKGHHGPIRCVRYLEPSGDLFATGSEDGTIRLWNNQYPPK